MKNISPNMGEAAKKAAKVLAKVVGRGLSVGGGVAVLGLGMAGCEITPAVPTQIISGVIVDSYHGNNNISGNTGTYYVVDQDRNPETKEDQRSFYVDDTVARGYPEIEIGTDIVFRWDEEHIRRGYSSIGSLIFVNGQAH
jgi:hypothetical protein